MVPQAQAVPERAARQGAHVAEMQRRRLLLAFVGVLGERGLEEASVGRVCKRAGVSRRTFYELFDDREECLLAAFDAAVERVGERVVQAYEAGGDWRARIGDALVVLVEQLDADVDTARMCVVETLKAGPVVLERRAGVLAVLVAAVEEGRAESKRGQEPPPLTGHGVVGGVLSVIHERLPGAAPNGHRPLAELTGSLVAMVVHPYLGSSAARRELDRPRQKTPPAEAATVPVAKDPFKGLTIRFTYRTARVLATIAAEGGRGSRLSNRQIADSSGVADEGQMSRLLTRLQSSGLIENQCEGKSKGEANAWRLTERGAAIHTTLTGH